MIDPSLEEAVEPERVGLYCFLNCERECGPECMAYLSFVPEGVDYRTPDEEPRQWARCMVLVNLHKGSKHLVHLATKAEEAMKLARVVKADQQRVVGIVPAPDNLKPPFNF